MNDDPTLTPPAPPQQPPPEPPSGSSIPLEDEHELHPVHEEDNVPEKPWHREQVRYLEGVLAAYLPDKWVTGNN